MSKLQKSKTLSLGRVASLSSIKENLRVKTAFQKNELPNVLVNLHPNNASDSDNNYGGGGADSPPLLFSAISSYTPEKTARARHGDENAHESSSYYTSSPRGRPEVTTASTVSSQGSPELIIRTSSGRDDQPQQRQEAGSHCEEDFEPPLFQSKFQRLYSSTNGSETVLQSVIGKDGEEIHVLADAEIERFQVRGVREEILSSVSSRTSSLTHIDDDLDEGSAENDDEEYWSIPPRVPDLLVDRRDLSTGDKWIPRHPDLVRVKGYHPFVAEAPLTTLMHFGFLTPTSLHFVHNHGPVPHATWDSWSIEVTGLPQTPKIFTMRELLLFPSRRLPVTLMCSGNRGKELSRVGSSGIGVNWGPGAVSTSVWGGARLRDVLQNCGAMALGDQKKKPNRRALGQRFFVKFLGADRYGTSIPLDVAMDETRDVLLAYEQNMDLLTPDHGFPVRLIVPGFTAGRSVKWLQKIEISDHDSENYYHVHENRLLPAHIEDLQTALSEGWMNRPEFVINDMNVNSVISSPAHNSNILSAGPSNPMKEYSIKGYAYSGAGKKIARVEVSLDGGKTWKLCNTEYPEQPTRFGKYWCWCFWELEVEVEDLSTSAEIVVRAWDCAMNTQPEILPWNLLGAMNNCWYRVKIVHEPAIVKDEPSAITFEHPTQPGGLPGGWLQEPTQLGHELERTISVKFRHSESSSSLDIGDNSPRTPRPWRI